MDAASAAQRVAILGDDDPTFVEDLRAGLQGAGIRSRVLTASTLRKVSRAPDLTLIVGDAALDGGLAAADALGDDHGPIAVVLAAGSLAVRLDARTRGLLVIPRVETGAVIAAEVERLLSGFSEQTEISMIEGEATEAGLGQVPITPETRPTADMDPDWGGEPGADAVQTSSAAVGEDLESKTPTLSGLLVDVEQRVAAAAGAAPAELALDGHAKERVAQLVERFVKEVASAVATPGGAPVEDLDWEDDNETIQLPGHEAILGLPVPLSNDRSEAPGPRGLGRLAPPREIGERTTLQGLQATEPDSAAMQKTVAAAPQAVEKEEDDEVGPDPVTTPKGSAALLDDRVKQRGSQRSAPRAAPPSPEADAETRMVRHPTAPLYEDATSNAPSDYVGLLAAAADDPNQTSPRHPVSKHAVRPPTSKPSERPTARDDSQPASDLPPASAAPSEPALRRAPAPPTGVKALGPSEHRAGPPAALASPSAPPMPLIPKAPKLPEEPYELAPPPAKPPTKKQRPRLALMEQSEPPPPLPSAAPANSAIGGYLLGALILLGGVAAAIWVLLGMPGLPGGDPSPAETAQPQEMGASASLEHDVEEAPPDLEEGVGEGQGDETSVGDDRSELSDPQADAPQASEPGAAGPETASAVAEPTVDGPAASSTAARARSSALVTAGRRHLRTGRLPEARRAFEQSIALNDENPDGHEGMARVELEQAHPEEALRHAERAAELRRTRARYHLLVGDARRALGDESAARRAYERAASLDPEDPTAEERLAGP